MKDLKTSKNVGFENDFYKKNEHGHICGYFGDLAFAIKDKTSIIPWSDCTKCIITIYKLADSEKSYNEVGYVVLYKQNRMYEMHRYAYNDDFVYEGRSVGGILTKDAIKIINFLFSYELGDGANSGPCCIDPDFIIIRKVYKDLIIVEDYCHADTYQIHKFNGDRYANIGYIVDECRCFNDYPDCEEKIEYDLEVFSVHNDTVIFADNYPEGAKKNEFKDEMLLERIRVSLLATSNYVNRISGGSGVEIYSEELISEDLDALIRNLKKLTKTK